MKKSSRSLRRLPAAALLLLLAPGDDLSNPGQCLVAIMPRGGVVVGERGGGGGVADTCYSPATYPSLIAIILSLLNYWSTKFASTCTCPSNLLQKESPLESNCFTSNFFLFRGSWRSHHHGAIDYISRPSTSRYCNKQDLSQPSTGNDCGVANVQEKEKFKSVSAMRVPAKVMSVLRGVKTF